MTSDFRELSLIALVVTFVFMGLTGWLIGEVRGGKALREPARRFLGVPKSYVHAGFGRVFVVTFCVAMLVVGEWAMWLNLADAVRIDFKLALPTLAHYAAAAGWSAYLAWGSANPEEERSG